MLRTSLAFALLLVGAVMLVPTPAQAIPSCDVLGGGPIVTPGTTVTVPIPGSVGPVTVPTQTVGGQSVGGGTVGGGSVGGQTVGPVAIPVLASVSGVPVVGTVTVGGTLVPATTLPSQPVPVVPVPVVTVPQQTVGGQTVGPVPTGLQPIVVTVFPQTVPASLDVDCTIQILNNVGWCLDELVNGGTVGRLTTCLRSA